MRIFFNLHKTVNLGENCILCKKKAGGYSRWIGPNGSAVPTWFAHCVARQCSDKSTFCCHSTCDTRHDGVDSNTLYYIVFEMYVFHSIRVRFMEDPLLADVIAHLGRYTFVV